MDGLLLAFKQHRLWHIDADWVGGGVHLINAADEGRAEAGGSMMVGKTIEPQGKVVRPSQLIRSVLRTRSGAMRSDE
jgi:hypothetical protein